MDDLEFRRIKNRRNLVDILVVLIPSFVLAVFFNYYRMLVDLSGTYDFVCGTVNHAPILYYVVPKFANHCDLIASAQQYGIRFVLRRDLLVLMDVAILFLPFVFVPYFMLNHKTHRLMLTRNWKQKRAKNKYFPASEIAFCGTLFFLMSWIVLVAPATFEEHSGPFVMMNLMADYGLGVFFHSLAASCIPYLCSALVIYWPLLNR